MTYLILGSQRQMEVSLVTITESVRAGARRPQRTNLNGYSIKEELKQKN